MSKRSPTSLEVKLRVVKRCLQNETNPSYEAKQLGIDKNTVTDWVRKYKADGLDGLKESTQKGNEYVRIDELLGKDEKRPMEKPQNGGQAGTSSHEKVIT
ncbi:helix-turn-helix domain-containing protein [Paenibacillus larvae]